MIAKYGMLLIAAALTGFAIFAAAGSTADVTSATAAAITQDSNGGDAPLPDFDGDGTVGFGDFVIFAGVFGARQGDERYEAKYDLNGDGEIGFSDFVIFAQNFGKDAPSPLVAIPDANLRAAIEAALDKAGGTPITRNEIATLDHLTDYGNGISDLTGVEFATNLKRLRLPTNNITDIFPLAGLTKLERLSLQNNTIADVSALANLTKLDFLNLTNNNITNITPLAGLTNLTELSLSENNITDISALTGLTELTGLYIWDNDISDLAPLVANTGLGNGDVVKVTDNQLDTASKSTHIPALVARGVRISFDDTEFVVFSEPQIYNDNVFVLPVSANLAAGNLPLTDYASNFYQYFSDDFDFLMFFPHVYREQLDPEAFRGAYFVHTKNDFEGIGLSTFFLNEWGSAARLQGAVNFSEAFYNEGSTYSRLITGPSLHELMHRWANFIVPAFSSAHWGFSSADGVLGGFILETLVDLGEGQYRAASFSYGGYSTNNVFYSPIELYLAGLLPPEEAPDLWVAEDGQPVLNEKGEWDFRHFTASRVKTYTIEDIIEKHGPRRPDHTRSRKDFRAAVILLVSEDYPVTRTKMEFLSADTKWFSHAGEVESLINNFYEATGGRATITMGGLSQFQRRAGSKKALPNSFGTPPPPTVDHWETGNGRDDAERTSRHVPAEAEQP